MATKDNPVDPESGEADEIRDEFATQVNMSASELENWLETEESKSVGQGDGESTGHRSGRSIVRILRKQTADLTGDDIGHMRKVNGYVSRHLAQRPDKSPRELADTDWAYSLKNWGHDPTKR